MPTAPTGYILVDGPGGTPSYAAIVYKDANGSLAVPQTPFYLNASGILVPAPLDVNGIPQTSLTGSSATLPVSVNTNYPIVLSPWGTTVTIAAGASWSSPRFTPENATRGFVFVDSPSGTSLSYNLQIWFQMETVFQGAGSGGSFNTFNGSPNDGSDTYVNGLNGYGGVRVALQPGVQHNIIIVNANTTDAMTFDGVGINLISGGNY